MDSEKIKQYLLDFQERKFPELKERGIQLKESSKIQTVIGARRTGKTYLFFSKIRDIERKTIKREQVVYLNFENPVLNEVSYKEFKDVIALHWSIFPEVGKLYVFIDEPQSIDKWELAVREIYDDIDCYLFVTGSSSALLSKEISTSLRGRAVSTVLLPLSFKEFLGFNDFSIGGKIVSTKLKSRLAYYLEEFLKFGGYPEVALEKDANEKLRILKDYFDMTVYKDIVDRYNVKNTRIVKWLIGYLVSAVAKEVSLNKVYLDIKSRGIKLSKNTLYEYFSMLEDSFFIFALRKFEDSIKKEGLSMPKVYLDDIGFLNLFSVADYGKRMENVVFLHLFRQKNRNPLMDMHYWKSHDGREVDFVISEGRRVKFAFQVCYSLQDRETRDREVNALLSGMEYFKLKEGTIITKDYGGEEKVGARKIKFVPLWKWLLELE